MSSILICILLLLCLLIFLDQVLKISSGRTSIYTRTNIHDLLITWLRIMIQRGIIGHGEIWMLVHHVICIWAFADVEGVVLYGGLMLRINNIKIMLGLLRSRILSSICNHFLCWSWWLSGMVSRRCIVVLESGLCCLVKGWANSRLSRRRIIVLKLFRRFFPLFDLSALNFFCLRWVLL